MRILLIIHNQVQTGPYAKVLEMCRALAQNDTEVTLLCTSKTNRWRVNSYQQSGITIVESPDWLWGSLRQGLDLWNTLRRIIFISRRKYDIVHAIDCRPAVILPALWLKKFRKTPLVLSWWDLFGRGGTAQERSGILYANTIGFIETFFEEYFRKYADYAFVISGHLKIKLLSLNFPDDKIALQRLGCDTREYQPGNKMAGREKLQINNHEIVLIYVGAIFEADLKLLLDSLKIVREKIDKPVKTIFVGNHTIDDKTVRYLNLRLAGRQPLEKVYEYLTASDLCLLPMKVSLANKARWPSKSADYFNAGRPVIATKVSDFEELYGKFRLGYLSESDTPEAFADTIIRAINDKENWQEIGNNARQFAVNYLDTGKLAAQTQAVYKSLIQN